MLHVHLSTFTVILSPQAAGLATMISTMRPDIDNMDEYVRNTTARAFAVVASALGIPSLLPFLKAVCKSKKSWQARHTGIKIVQQIAILMGCAILPHLKNLVEIIEHGQFIFWPSSVVLLYGWSLLEFCFTGPCTKFESEYSHGEVHVHIARILIRIIQLAIFIYFPSSVPQERVGKASQMGR